MSFKSQIKQITSASELVRLEQPEQEFVKLEADRFYPDPDQPRKTFEQSKLDSLQAKIELQGQLQPIVVRPMKDGESKHKIISGERRWRAISQSNKVKTVAAVIRSEDMDDRTRRNLASRLEIDEEEISDDMLTNSLQIDENNEREDITCIENAKSYQKMVDDLSGDKTMAAKALRMSPSYLSKFLSILKADERVKALSDNNICQDVNTLYIANSLLKVDEARGLRLIKEWPDLVDKGRSMREVASEVIREVKANKNRDLAGNNSKRSRSNKKERRDLPKASSAAIFVTSRAVRLDLKVGSSHIAYELPKKVFEALKQQIFTVEEGANYG
jgi:ParB family transcriptional regulator, chromosome partitioning protein